VSGDFSAESRAAAHCAWAYIMIVMFDYRQRWLPRLWYIIMGEGGIIIILLQTFARSHETYDTHRYAQTIILLLLLLFYWQVAAPGLLGQS
jgi:hypothetical protein